MKWATETLGFRPYLIEIRVPLEVAQERALRRGRATGRLSTKEYIKKAQKELTEVLRLGRSMVQNYDGGVVAIYDNTFGGGARLQKINE